MNIDISYQGFVSDFFRMVQLSLNLALEFATSIVNLFSTPVTELLSNLIDVLPPVLELPFVVLDLILLWFVEDSADISLFTFAFSSWVVVYITVHFVGFIKTSLLN